jgi:hypothetical protein
MTRFIAYSQDKDGTERRPMTGNVQMWRKFRDGTRAVRTTCYMETRFSWVLNMAAINHARIHIIGPDQRGGFVVEFRKHTGARLAFVVPANADSDMLAYFQQRIPYGIAVPDLNEPVGIAGHGATRKRFWPPQE